MKNILIKLMLQGGCTCNSATYTSPHTLDCGEVTNSELLTATVDCLLDNIYVLKAHQSLLNKIYIIFYVSKIFKISV